MLKTNVIQVRKVNKATSFTTSYAMSALRDVGKDIDQKYGSGAAKSLSRDLMASLYSGQRPVFEGQDPSDPIIEYIYNSESMAELKEAAAHNIWVSDLVTGHFMRELSQQEEEQGGDSGGDQEQGEGEGARGEGQADQPGNDESKGDGNHDADAIEAAMQATEQSLEGGTLASISDATATSEFPPFDNERMDPELLARIVNRMGRTRNVVFAAMAQKVRKMPGAPIRISMGNSLRHAVKSQLVHLGEETEPVLWQQWMNHGLLQREMVGVGRAGKGPVILGIDSSGSMFSKKHDGVLVEWALGLGGALGWAAAARHRDIAFVFYSSSVCDIVLLTSEHRRSTEMMERGIASIMYHPMVSPHPLSAIPEMRARGIQHRTVWSSGDGVKVESVDPWEASLAFGSGTQFKVVYEAVDSLMRMDRRWHGADLVLLTDGQDGNTELSERMYNVASSGGLRVFGIGMVPDHESEKEKEKLSTVMKGSLGYLDRHAVAEIGKQANADDVLAMIASEL